MRAFRIGRSVYPVFDGTGAAKTGGRWNKKDTPVIYCANNLAAARLEILVGLVPKLLPKDHVWISVDIPDEVSVSELTDALLPAGWDNPLHTDISRDIGEAWLSSLASLVLVVPSVAAKGDKVILINPRHPDFPLLKPTEPRHLDWDDRLFQ